MTDIDIPITNPSDVSAYDTCFCMWAGEGYDKPTKLYVWASSLESAFEEFVEWLDDHAPGRLVSHEHAENLLSESAKELGIDLTDCAEEDTWRAQEHADSGLTIIGHTSLKNGWAIASHEWGGDEVTGEDLAQVRARSIEHVLQEDLEAIETELLNSWHRYGDTAIIDVRLQVFKDARWSVRRGLVDYDQDHTGYCGAGSVDADTDCAELAKELIEQVIEQCAMSAE